MQSLLRVTSNPWWGRITPLLGLPCLLLAATPAEAAAECPLDKLYIGDLENPTADVPDDTVAEFDVLADTGKVEYRGDLVSASDNGGLDGVIGLIFDNKGGPTGNLLAVNQDLKDLACIPSEVLIFDRFSGDFLGPLVSKTSPDAPYTARGLVLGKQHTLYLADMGCGTNLETHPGSISGWGSKAGEFLGEFFVEGLSGPFRPRGIVFGPDGDLYVSVVYFLIAGDPTDPGFTGGAIVRIDPETGTSDVIYDCPSSTACNLHRPEGLAFSPDGALYVASFRRDPSDVDRILIFYPEADTAPFDQIDLWKAGEPRAFAQALLFGPGGDLYVPISGGSTTHTGSVRRYDVHSKSFDVIVKPFAAGGPLQTPNYLTFGRTDPATLEYKDHPQCL